MHILSSYISFLYFLTLLLLFNEISLHIHVIIQGVNNILCFFEDFKIYPGLWPISVSVSVHNGRSNTNAAEAELAEFRKITTF